MEEEETGARSPLITFSHFLPHQVLSMHRLGDWSRALNPKIML